MPRLFHDLGERIELSDHHRGHALTGLAYFLERALHKAVVADLVRDDSDETVLIAVHPIRTPHGRYLAQRVPQPVDAGQSRERVIDRGRERAQGDFDELIDAEGDVLSERAVGAGHVCPVKVVSHPSGSLRW